MDGLSSNKEAMEMMPANPMALHGQPNGQVRNFFHLTCHFFVMHTLSESENFKFQFYVAY